MCLITDRGFPATAFLLSRGVLLPVATGSGCRRFPSSQTYLARRHYSTALSRRLARGPLGRRPARAGTNRRTAQSCRPIIRYQETPFIVIRNTGQPYRGVSGITAPFLHVP